ncbi:hypothetical protein A5662_20885 [Mycobacteriaceae bacterium 1482268.1]|nr:hypothetical protein A5662_20885 [Mycobacteriaceae bacterium 1482268.1]
MTADTAEKVRTLIRRMAANPRWWVLAACYLAVFATTAGFSQRPTGDALEYRQIAAAAPNLPTQPVSSAYAGRFAIHYVVGLLSNLTGLSLDRAYDLVWAALVFVLFLVIFALFSGLDVGGFALCAALFVFNPYSLRPYILQAGLLEAILFIIGIGICLVGLTRQATLCVIAGLIVAVLGRQTAILVAPVAAAWVLIDPAWRQAIQRRTAWLTAFFSLTATFVIYVGFKLWSARFSTYFEPTAFHNSIFNLVADLPNAIFELAAHFARTAIPLAVPLAVFTTLVALVGWRRVAAPCWGSLLIALAIVVQPALTDPRFPGAAHNEQRQAALALLPLVCAVAGLLSQTCRRSPGPSRVVLIVALLAAASLHHEYTAIGPKTLPQFVGIQLLVAVAVAGVLAFDRRPCLTPHEGQCNGADCYNATGAD